MVAGFPYQGFGFFEMRAGPGGVIVGKSEAGGNKVVVGEVEPHTGACRYPENILEIVRRTTGEKSERDEGESSSAPKEVNGLVEMESCFSGAWELGDRKSTRLNSSHL